MRDTIIKEFDGMFKSASLKSERWKRGIRRRGSA